MGFGKCHLFFGCDKMKFFIISLFLLLLLDNPQGSTLSHRRSIRGLNTTLQTNFNGTYERRNPCTNTEIETSSYTASHEFRHYTKQDDWSDYSRKCSAIISGFLQAIGNLVRFNSKQDGIFNFHINTSITQKQESNCDTSKSSCNSLPTIIIEATDGEIIQRPPPPATELPPCERIYSLEGRSSNDAQGVRDGMVTNTLSPGVPFGEENGNQKSATVAYRKPTNLREQQILLETSSPAPVYQPDITPVSPPTGVPKTASGTGETASPLLHYITETEGPPVSNNLLQNLRTESDRTIRPEPQTEIYVNDAIRQEDKFTPAYTPTEIQLSTGTFDTEIPSKPRLTYPNKPESIHLVSSPIPPEGYNQQTEFNIPKTTPNVPFYHSTPDAVRSGTVNIFQPSLVHGQPQQNINSEQLLNDNLGEPIFNSQQSANSFTPENQIPTTALPPPSRINSLKDKSPSESLSGLTEQVPPALVGSTVTPTPNIRVSTIHDVITREEYSSPRPAEIPSYTKTPLSTPVPEQVGFSQPNINTYELGSSLPPQISDVPNIPTFQEPQDRFMNSPGPEILLGSTMPPQSENRAAETFLLPAAAPKYDELSDQMPVTKPPLAEDNFYTDAVESYNYGEPTPSLETSNSIPTTPPTSLSGLPPDYIDSDAGIPPDSDSAFFPPQFPRQAPVLEETEPQIAGATFAPQSDISNEPSSNIREPINENRPPYPTFAPKQQFLSGEISDYPSTIPPENQNFFAPESEQALPPLYSERNLDEDINESPDKITGTQLPLSVDHLPAVSAPINSQNNEFSYSDPIFNANNNPAGPSTLQTTTITPLHSKIQPLHPTIGPNFIGPKPELIEPSSQQRPTGNFENSHFPPTDINEFHTTPGLQRDSTIHPQQTPNTFIQPESQLPNTSPFLNFPPESPPTQPEGNFDMIQTQTTPAETYEVITTETYTTARPESQPAVEYAGFYDNRLSDSNNYARQPQNTFRPTANTSFSQYPPTFPPEQQPTGNYEIPPTQTFPQLQTTAGFESQASEVTVFPNIPQTPNAFVQSDSQTVEPSAPLNQFPSTQGPDEIVQPQSTSAIMFPDPQSQGTIGPKFQPSLQSGNVGRTGLPDSDFVSTPTPNAYGRSDPEFAGGVRFDRFPSTFPPEQQPIQNYEGQTTPAATFKDLQTTVESEIANERGTQMSDPSYHNQPIPHSFAQPNSQLTGSVPINSLQNYETVQDQSTLVATTDDSKLQTIPPQPQIPIDIDRPTRLPGPVFYDQQIPKTFVQPESEFIENAPSGEFPPAVATENYKMAQGQPTVTIEDSMLPTTAAPELKYSEEYPNDRMPGFPDPAIYNQEVASSSIQPDSQLINNAAFNQFPSAAEQQENLEHSQSTPPFQDSVLQTTAAPESQNLEEYGSGRITGLSNPTVYDQEVSRSSFQPDSQLISNEPFSQFPSTGFPEQQPIVNNETEQPQATSVAMYEGPRSQTVAPQYINDRMPVTSDPVFYNQQAPNSFIPTYTQPADNVPFTTLSPESQIGSYDTPQSQRTSAYEGPQLQTNTENKTPVQFTDGRTTGLPDPVFYNEQNSDNFAQPDSRLEFNAPTNQFPPTFPAEQQPVGNYDMTPNQFTPAVTTEGPQLQTTQPVPQYASDRTPIMPDPIFYNQQTPNAFIPREFAESKPFTTLSPGQQTGNHEIPQPQRTVTTITGTEFSTTARPNDFVQPESQVAASQQFPPAMLQGYRPFTERSFPFENSTSTFNDPETGNQVVSPSYDNQPFVKKDEFQAETESPLEYYDQNFGRTTQIPLYGPTPMPFKNQPGSISVAQSFPGESLNEPLGNTEHTRTTFSSLDPNTSVGLEVQPLPSTASASPYPGQILNDNMVTPIPDTSALNSEQTAPVISSPIRQSPTDIYVSDSLPTANPNGDDYQDPLYSKPENPSFITPRPIFNYATSKQAYAPGEQSILQSSTDPSAFDGDKLPINKYPTMTGEPEANQSSDGNLGQSLEKETQTQSSDIYSTAPVEYQTTESTHIPSEMSSIEAGNNIGYTASPPTTESYTPYGAVPVYVPPQQTSFIPETNSNGGPQMTNQFEQGPSMIAPYIGDDFPREAQRKFSQPQRDGFSEFNKEITSSEPTVDPMAIPEQIGDSNQMSTFGPSETYPPVDQQPTEAVFGSAETSVNSFVTPQPSSAQTVPGSNEYVSYAQTQSSSELDPQSLISTVGNDQPLRNTFQPSHVPESQTTTTLPYWNEPSVDLKPSFAASKQKPLDSPLETTPWLFTRNQTIKPNDFQNLDSTFVQPENVTPSYNSPWVTSGTTTPPSFATTVPPQFPSRGNQELDASLPSQPVKAYSQIPLNIPPQFPPPSYVVDPLAATGYPSPSPSVDYYSDAPGYDANLPDYIPQKNAEEFQTRSPAPEANIPLNYAETIPPVVAEGTPAPELQGNGPYVDEMIPTSQPNFKSQNVQEEMPVYLSSPVTEPQPQPSLEHTTEIPDYKTVDGLDQTSRTFDNSSPLQLNSEEFTNTDSNLANTFQPGPQADEAYIQDQMKPKFGFSQNSGEEFNTPTVSYPPALGTTDTATETPIPYMGEGGFSGPSTPYQTFPTPGSEPVGVAINPMLPIRGPSETQSAQESNVLPEIQPTVVNYNGETNAYQSSPAPQPQTTLTYVERLSDDKIANISPDQTVTASPEFETTPAMTYDQFSPSRNPEIPGTQHQTIPESQPESLPLSESQQLGSVHPQSPYTMPPIQQTGGFDYDSEIFTTDYPSTQTSEPQPNLPMNDQAPVNGIPLYHNQQKFQPTESLLPANQLPEQISAPPFLGQIPTAIPPPVLAQEVTPLPAHPIPESQLPFSNFAPQVTETQEIYNSGEELPENRVHQSQNDQVPQVLDGSYEIVPTTPQIADSPILDSNQPPILGPNEPIPDAYKQPEPEISPNLQQTLNQPTLTYSGQNLNDRIPSSDSFLRSTSDFDGSQTQSPFFGTYPGSNSEESGSFPSHQPPAVGPQTQPPLMSFPPTFERKTTPPFIPYPTEPPFNYIQDRTTENVQEISDFPTDAPFDPQLSHLNNNNNNQLPPLQTPPPAYGPNEVPVAESSSHSDPQTSVRNSHEVILENPTLPGTPSVPADYDEGFSTQPPENRFTEHFESTPTARNPANVLTGGQPFDGLTGQPDSHDSQLPIRPQTDSPLDFEEGPSRRPMIFTPDSEHYSPLQEETPSNPLLQTLESHLSIPFHESPQPSSFPEPTALEQINTTPIPSYSLPPAPQPHYGVSTNPPYFRRPEFDPNFVTSQPQPNTGVSPSQDLMNAPQPVSRALVSDPTTPSNEPDRTRTGRHGYMSGPLRNPFMRSFG